MSADRQNPRARKFPAIELRRATVADVDTLVDLFATFFDASQYRPYLAYDPVLAKRYLTHAVGSGYSPHIIAMHGNRIVGVACYHIDNTFSSQPLAVMDEIFALPEYRRSHAGRLLASRMLQFAKADGAAVMHIPITSGHASQFSLINLFRKFGAEVIGVVMRVRL